jgi:hypothetical protein
MDTFLGSSPEITTVLSVPFVIVTERPSYTLSSEKSAVFNVILFPCAKTIQLKNKKNKKAFIIIL